MGIAFTLSYLCVLNRYSYWVAKDGYGLANGLLDFC